VGKAEVKWFSIYARSMALTTPSSTKKEKSDGQRMPILSRASEQRSKRTVRATRKQPRVPVLRKGNSRSTGDKGRRINWSIIFTILMIVVVFFLIGTMLFADIIQEEFLPTDVPSTPTVAPDSCLITTEQDYYIITCPKP
jgi:hypothetical protein